MLREAYEAARAGDQFVVGGLPQWQDRDKYAQKRMRQILRLAKIDYAKPFHTLRKCRESEWMAKYPVPTVAEWLGHDPTVALVHYTRAPESHFQQASAPQGMDPQAEIRRLEQVIDQLRKAHAEPTANG
jgi:integrase